MCIVQREKNLKKNIEYASIPAPVTCVCKTATLPHYFTFHAHNGFEILPFVSGNVSLYYEKDSIYMRPGDVILIPPYVFHRGYQNDETPYVRDVLNIREDYTISGREEDYSRLLHLFFSGDNQKIKVIRPNPESFDMVHHLMKQVESVLNEPADFDSLLLRDTFITQILILLYRAQKSHPNDWRVSDTWPESMPSFIIETFQYINTHLTGEVSLDALAEAVHINKYYLCRTFHEFTGGSIGQYVIEKRLSIARQKLKAGIRPYDACFQSGFSNYANFSRTFNRHVGLSPKAYQMAMRVGGENVTA